MNRLYTALLTWTIPKFASWLIVSALVAMAGHHVYLKTFYKEVSEELLDETLALPSGTIEKLVDKRVESNDKSN